MEKLILSFENLYGIIDVLRNSIIISYQEQKNVQSGDHLSIGNDVQRTAIVAHMPILLMKTRNRPPPLKCDTWFCENTNNI